MPDKRVASIRRSATPVRSPLAPQLSMTRATMASVLGTAQSTDGAPPEMRWAALALRLSQFPSAVIALRQDLTDLLGTSLSCSHTHRPAFL